jgi:hypothetical protein
MAERRGQEQDLTPSRQKGERAASLQIPENTTRPLAELDLAKGNGFADMRVASTQPSSSGTRGKSDCYLEARLCNLSKK